MKIYSRNELNNYHLSLTYDDISLVPAEISRIKTRVEPDTKINFLGEDLSLPVLSSPMDSVTGNEMAQVLGELGCLGIVNRFDSSVENLVKISSGTNNIKAVSAGLNTGDDLWEKIAAHNYVVCIDTANANNNEVLKKIEYVKSKYNLRVIAGNIASGATLQSLESAGTDAIRVGIGSGSVCTTSIQTGIGIGQVSSLLDVCFKREEQKLKIKIIADGGIKSAGDVAKAISLGADTVMLGRMLAGSKEAPGEVIKYNGQLWKKYRGSASFGVKMKNEFIEGEETMVPYRGTVRNIINSISDGLRSAMSYMNSFNLDELRGKESFAILSNSSYLERLPRT